MARSNQDLNKYTIHGEFTEISGTLVSGWAHDFNTPAMKLTVEIYVDGACVGVTRADKVRQDKDAKRAIFSGFDFDIPQPLLKGARIISGRIANSGPWFANNIEYGQLTGKTRDNSPSRAKIGSYHVDGFQVKGWIKSSSKIQTDVFAFEGQYCIAKTIANIEPSGRETENELIKRFIIDLPPSIADGKLHKIFIRSNDGLLSDTPIKFYQLPCKLSEMYCTVKNSRSKEKIIREQLFKKALEIHDIKNYYCLGFHHYHSWYETHEVHSSIMLKSANIRFLVLAIKTADKNKNQVVKQKTPIFSYPKTKYHLTRIDETDLSQIITQESKNFDYIIPVFDRDRLSDNSLSILNDAIANSNFEIIYGDCDQISLDGKHTNPWLKPSWDEFLFYGFDYISTGVAIKSSLLMKAVKSVPNGKNHRCMSWDSLLARAISLSKTEIKHIPRIIYHRCANAFQNPAQISVSRSRIDAISNLINQRAAGAKIDGYSRNCGLLKVSWPLPKRLPKVSLIIPTRDRPDLLGQCLDGLLHNTDYTDVEIIIIDNGSVQEETQNLFKQAQNSGVSIVKYDLDFNYSDMHNYAIKKARGNIIGLINNDVSIIDSQWLKEMVSILLLNDVGCVGAKLLWPNNLVQHGGVVVGVEGLAAHAGNSLNDSEPGYLGLNLLTKQQSAVTAACMLFYKSDYMLIGGFDADHLPVAFNDVDFCLELRKLRKKIIWTPFSKLYHHESASRGEDLSPDKFARAKREREYFISKWTENGFCDPFYHPALNLNSLSGPYGGLEFFPRERKLR